MWRELMCYQFCGSGLPVSGKGADLMARCTFRPKPASELGRWRQKGGRGESLDRNFQQDDTQIKQIGGKGKMTDKMVGKK